MQLRLATLRLVTTLQQKAGELLGTKHFAIARFEDRKVVTGNLKCSVAMDTAWYSLWWEHTGGVLFIIAYRFPNGL